MDFSLFYYLCAFGVGWGVKTAADYLKDYQSDPTGTDQLFNFDVVIEDEDYPGLILLRSGAILLTYKMDGVDTTTATDEQLEGVTQELNNWLKNLGDGWAIYFTNRRTHAKQPDLKGNFSSSATALFDHLRQKQYNESDDYFTSSLYLSVAYKPKGQVGSKKAVDSFKQQLFDVEDYIEDYLGLRPLKKQEHLSFIHDCINFDDRVITDRNHFISPILASNELITGRNPQIGDYYFSCFSIIGFPPSTEKDMLRPLDTVDIPMRWTTRVVTMDKATQRSIIKNERNYHAISSKDLSQRAQGALVTKDDSNDLEAKKEKEALSEEASYSVIKDGTKALSAIRENEKSFFQFTSTVLIYDKTKEGLKDKEREIAKLLKKNEFAFNNNGFNNVDAWIGSVPAHVNNQKRYLLSTENISDIIPTSTSWEGKNITLQINFLIKVHRFLSEKQEAMKYFDITDPPKATLATA